MRFVNCVGNSCTPWAHGRKNSEFINFFNFCVSTQLNIQADFKRKVPFHSAMQAASGKYLWPSEFFTQT